MCVSVCVCLYVCVCVAEWYPTTPLAYILNILICTKAYNATFTQGR